MPGRTVTPVVYLAGPEVFLPKAVEIGEAKKRICEQHDLVGLFPLDGAAQPTGAPADQGHAIFSQCLELMNQCDLIIANMTAFRGPSMDVGTAIEVGYMYG